MLWVRIVVTVAGASLVILGFVFAWLLLAASREAGFMTLPFRVVMITRAASGVAIGALLIVAAALPSGGAALAAGVVAFASYLVYRWAAWRERRKERRLTA